MRYSKQREVILQVLKPRKDHPTADDIYLEARKALPHISLGTVYRNLEKLSSEGSILCLDYGSQKRFDPNPSTHVHFFCNQCSKVEDVFYPVDEIISKMKNFVTKQKIETVFLSFTGVCEECNLYQFDD